MDKIARPERVALGMMVIALVFGALLFSNSRSEALRNREAEIASQAECANDPARKSVATKPGARSQRPKSAISFCVVPASPRSYQQSQGLEKRSRQWAT
jgi:hypothetical protein